MMNDRRAPQKRAAREERRGSTEDVRETRNIETGRRAPGRGAAMAQARLWLRAMRPHQWVKNLLVLLPILAAHRTDAAGWADALLAAAAFCLAASSAYVVNDLADREADRAHPVKRSRPFASGELAPREGAVAAPLLLAGALGLAWAVSPLVMGIVAFYYGATLLYSLMLKRELAIDICLLSGLYTLRVIAGTEAIGSHLTPWILAFCTSLFLSLAALKRQAELARLADEGRDAADRRAYVAGDLPVVAMMAVASGYLAVLLLGLYIHAPQVKRLYESPMMLWGLPPVLLYWISRAAMLAHRGQFHEDPVVFALRDRVSQACAAGMVAMAVAARFL